MSLMRLDKYLAHATQKTRSEVKKDLKNGIITVNGRTETHPERKVDPETDRISLSSSRYALLWADFPDDGSDKADTISWKAHVWLMFHKPGGCVTSTDDRQHRTVMDYIDYPRKAELFPVGRLDLDTEGLLLLTNDGAQAHRMLSPRHHVEKTYFARVRGRLAEADVESFAEGMDIGEKRLTLPAKLHILEPVQTEAISEAEVTLCEGKFHQVRRMFAARGCEVLYLKRISMAGLTLDETLAPGSWRELTEEETERLYTYAEAD